MKYELIYFTDKGAAVKEETDNYAIYQVSDDKKHMRCFYQKMNGKEYKYPNDPWCNYNKYIDNLEHDIDEKDVFLICL